jgi:hypothetical protein
LIWSLQYAGAGEYPAPVEMYVIHILRASTEHKKKEPKLRMVFGKWIGF